MTLAHWQASSEHVAWAQRNETFREILAVLSNERGVAAHLDAKDAVQAARVLGQREGYDLALNVLHSLARGAERQRVEPSVEYAPEETKEVVYD